MTHGHEDHIGALPYVLRRLDVPVWGTALTLGFLRNKLSEHHLLEVSRLNDVEFGDIVRLGDFEIEYVRMSHSIPDAAGLVIRTPIGNVVVSGDFKFDQNPIDGNMMDVGRLARIGDEGVLVLADRHNQRREARIHRRARAWSGRRSAGFLHPHPGG